MILEFVTMHFHLPLFLVLSCYLSNILEEIRFDYLLELTRTSLKYDVICSFRNMNK